MRNPRFARLGLPTCLLACLLLAGGLPLDLENTTWTLPSMKGKASTKVGKQKAGGKAEEPMTLFLLPGDAWLLESLSFADLSGSYTRKSETAKKLVYTVSGASLQNVADQLEQDIEDALDADGINAVITITTATGKMATGLKIKKKLNTVSARARMGLKFSGSVARSTGTFGVKVKAKAKGLSDPKSLDTITK